MNRTTVITQPTYLPWLGYFEQIARADTFIFLDTVQYVKRSWHSRNQIKASTGQPFWLSVPVQTTGQNTPLSEVRISADHPQWKRKHLDSIRIHLGRAPFFRQVFPLIEGWMNRDFEYLVDLTMSGIRLLSDLLELKPAFEQASRLKASGKRTDLLLGLCQEVGTETYYTAAGSKAYLEMERGGFETAGIAVRYQQWPHPVYTQLGTEFVSHLSVLDALMNLGPRDTRSLIVPTHSTKN